MLARYRTGTIMVPGAYVSGMGCRPRLPETVCEQARDVMKDHDYRSLGEAIRHMVREGGYDV